MKIKNDQIIVIKNDRIDEHKIHNKTDKLKMKKLMRIIKLITMVVHKN